MGYFPAFIKLDKQRILIVGGGNIAYEKLERLLDFTKDITVIAAAFSEKMHEKISEHALAFEQRAYRQDDIKGFSLVIVAVDDIALQAQIYEECKAYRCLCNAVDSVEYCDFIFPSYVKKDDLTIAISTSGASPAMAKYLKQYIASLIPAGVTGFLDEMRRLRNTLPKGKERMKMLDEKAAEYIKTWSKR